MKKLFCGFLIILCLVCLSGCQDSSAHGLQSIISAIGFDSQNGKITACFEAVIINSEDTSKEKSAELKVGEGDSVKEAIEQIHLKSLQPLMLSHCAVVALGESLSAEQLGEVLNYCYEQDRLTLSVNFVACENAKNLLSLTPVSSIAMGYDIADMLQLQNSYSDISYRNRFYNVEAARTERKNSYTLPYFKEADGVIMCDSVAVYQNDRRVAIKSNRKHKNEESVTQNES